MNYPASTLAMAVWFLLYGINQFASIPAIGIILGIIGLIIAVLLLLGGRVNRAPGAFL